MTVLTGKKFPDVISFHPDFLPDWFDAPTVLNRHILGAITSNPVAGELSDTQPITENPSVKHGVYVRSFREDFYNRIHVTPSVVAGGSIVGEQTRTVTIFNGFFHDSSLTAIAAANNEGINLTGFAIPTTLGPLATIAGTLTIGTEGPPNIDASYTYSFDDYDDIVQFITGIRTITLPWQPIAGYSEKLNWLTQVLTSEDGNEQRICLRFAPRQSFDGNYPIPADQLARADNLVFGWIGQTWAVPVWSETQALSGLTAGDSNIVCETGTIDLRVGALVLFWSSPTGFEVATISAINVGSIDLAKPLQNSYSSCVMMPCRSGTADESMTISKTNYGGEIEVEFTCTDNIDLGDGTAPTQYLGEDLYLTEVLAASNGSFSDKYQTKIKRVDYGGKFAVFLPWDTKKVYRSVRYMLETRAELWAFRKFLHRRKGALKPFWMPTFENNLRLNMSGVVANSLTVQSDDYNGMADARDNVAIQLDDGSWVVAAITGASSAVDGSTSIGITVNLNVDATRIRRISYLSMYRFASDEIEISYPGNQVADCTVALVQIDS